MFLLRSASNDRDWSPDQAVLPWADIDCERITVHNIRLCTYRSTHDYDVAYYDRTFDLALLRSVDCSTPGGLRDFTLLYLAASCGLRSGELVRLTLDAERLSERVGRIPAVLLANAACSGAGLPR